MENDIVFLDDEMRLCGFSVGMSDAEGREYCEKYNLHPATYGEWEKYWRGKE